MVRSDNMLTTSDIASGVGIAESTVRAYNTRGQMPCNKSSAKVVQQADAEAALADHPADTLAPEVEAHQGPLSGERVIMTKHHVYVRYRYTGEDDEAFVVFCETCMAGSPDFATKKPATKLRKAHAADPVAHPVHAVPMRRGSDGPRRSQTR